MTGEGPVNRVTVSAPSQNVVTANITGRAAHAGLEPEKGLSAILIAAGILTKLPLGRIDEETTANIGRMDAGLKRNIIPEAAFLDGEIRSRDNNKLDRISAEFERVFSQASEEHPDARISLDIESTYRAYSINASHPAIAGITRALDALGSDPGTQGQRRRLRCQRLHREGHCGPTRGYRRPGLPHHLGNGQHPASGPRRPVLPQPDHRLTGPFMTGPPSSPSQRKPGRRWKGGLAAAVDPPIHDAP